MTGALTRFLLTLTVTATLLLSLGAGLATAQSSDEPNVEERLQSLIEVLRDDASREALITELEEIASPDEAEGEAPAKPQHISIGRRLAEFSQDVIDTVIASFEDLWDQLSETPQIGTGMGPEEVSILFDALLDLALIIVITVSVFAVLRIVARRIFQMMGTAAHDSSLTFRAFFLVGSVLIDAATVLIAWAIGYGISIAVLDGFGQVGFRQTLYLNAFLIVEMSKVAIRAILVPSTAELRAIPMPDRGARSLSSALAWIASLIGYGQLLIVPIINRQVSLLAGEGISGIILLISVLILMWLVVANRKSVAEALSHRPDGESRTGFLQPFIVRWHWPVLAYLVVLFFIVVTRPEGVLVPFLIGSVEVLAAIIGGAIATSFLHRSIAHGIHLPEFVTTRLPMLERRLNTFIPAVLTALRFVILGAVLVYTIHKIGGFDLRAWLDSLVGANFAETLISVFFIVLISFLVWLAFSSWVDFRLNTEFGKMPSAREQTLLTLLRNAVTILLVVVTMMFILSEVGINIAPLIASAGVFGLAIGFGAQKMVQDIITGIFIQFENAMNVGDVVTVGGTTGTIERLTIRSVSLRDVQGVFHIIPFSSVDMVSNYMRDYGNFVCDMGIAYRESIDDAKQAMLDGFEELRAKPEWRGSILGDLQWFGLQSFGDSAVVVRARIKCVPGQQWSVGRAYNEILKRIFDERGIEIPFPHQTIYFGEDKAGNAPPAHVQLRGGSQTVQEG
ncbi:mechanosensitive ion channel [Rhodobacteraceae bacterium NNCM2]|nr:mechanosensitive ion channel [Coraliihabitans acroporae]